jgi:hypothetical protein
MGFKKDADGITKTGKTDAKVYPNGGPTVSTVKGGKGSKGVTGEAMRAVGRNMARANNQK